MGHQAYTNSPQDEPILERLLCSTLKYRSAAISDFRASSEHECEHVRSCQSCYYLCCCSTCFNAGTHS